MSAPQVNPDPRPLPAGWVARYDPNMHTWYYINTFAQPPVRSWQHPLGPPASITSQHYYGQSQKPELPPQASGYGGPTAPSNMAQNQGNFYGHGNASSPHPGSPPLPIQPPQQAYYSQGGSPQAAPGPYSNYGAQHSNNQAPAGNNPAQQSSTNNGTGCLSGLFSSPSAKTAEKSIIRVLIKEGTNFVKKHLMNQPDNNANNDQNASDSQLNDKVVQLNGAMWASPAITTNGYGDQYQSS